jgi:hypothetical protein
LLVGPAPGAPRTANRAARRSAVFRAVEALVPSLRATAISFESVSMPGHFLKLDDFQVPSRTS